MRRLLGILAAIGLMAVVFPTSASADTTTTTPPPDTVTITMSTNDAAPVTVVNNQPIHQCFGDWCNYPTLSTQYYTGGRPSGAGCKTLEIWISKKTAFGFVAYTFHLQRHWCWGFGTVYNVTGQAWLADLDDTHQPNPGAKAHGNDDHWYTFGWGLSNSGYYSLRNTAVNNCYWVFCGTTTYPWIWERLHGDGTYSYDWGYY